MRKEKVMAFEYPSARDPNGDNNVALYSPSALRDKAPRNQTPCLAETTGDGVTFSIERKITEFTKAQFLLDGVFPRPAA